MRLLVAVSGRVSQSEYGGVQDESPVALESCLKLQVGEHGQSKRCSYTAVRSFESQKHRYKIVFSESLGISTLIIISPPGFAIIL